MTRRSFLGRAWRAGAALGTSLLALPLVRFASWQAGPAQAAVRAGPASAFPPGSRLPVAGQPLWIVHEAGGDLAAVLGRCTHLGCPLESDPSSGGWRCPCHGSRFDPSGAAVHGPATRPLPHAALWEEDGVLWADPAHPVPAGTRLRLEEGGA
ncbi:QcrA and Rieske domain-containing protein [Limnochorda pilosa]|uniref:(2Fe-2S)-binding protein n=1 Tax=Limnochorda pilosa TaxID=1555112 RepID=A0A0K2SJD9_LIMPI|nr:Rieske (2Fe-2S) protein [Limnochorda pilosa]BAS27195.1 (2Fe-2S)-binding protein [Limnochorda pilosa]